MRKVLARTPRPYEEGEPGGARHHTVPRTRTMHRCDAALHDAPMRRSAARCTDATQRHVTAALSARRPGDHSDARGGGAADQPDRHGQTVPGRAPNHGHDLPLHPPFAPRRIAASRYIASYMAASVRCTLSAARCPLQVDARRDHARVRRPWLHNRRCAQSTRHGERAGTS